MDYTIHMDGIWVFNEIFAKIDDGCIGKLPTAPLHVKSARSVYRILRNWTMRYRVSLTNHYSRWQARSNSSELISS